MGFRSVESKIIPFRLIKKSNLYSLSFGEGWGEDKQKNYFIFLIGIINGS
jgi:hypothetical protein